MAQVLKKAARYTQPGPNHDLPIGESHAKVVEVTSIRRSKES